MAPIYAFRPVNHCGPVFRRSTFCAELNCVEVAATAGGDILVRDTKDEDGPVLRFTAQEWVDFLSGVIAGEFTWAALVVG